MKKEFGSVHWEISDIQRLKPNWSDEKCEDFLIDIEDDLVDAITITGLIFLEKKINIKEFNDNEE